MSRPKAGYHATDGGRVPGTTTIIGRFKESGGLIHWAWDLGTKGIDYRAARDGAADSGTIAHELVEQRIQGQTHEPEACEHWKDADAETRARALGAYGAYLSWETMSRLELVHTEVVLVSEKFRYGGTLDAIGRINGDLCLCDWKSSNAVYADYLLQLAAYKNLWEENHPEEPLKGLHLMRFSKDKGDFSHRYYPELDEAWHAFLLCRQLYELDKEIKKRVA